MTSLTRKNKCLSGVTIQEPLHITKDGAGSIVIALVGMTILKVVFVRIHLLAVNKLLADRQAVNLVFFVDPSLFRLFVETVKSLVRYEHCITSVILSSRVKVRVTASKSIRREVGSYCSFGAVAGYSHKLTVHSSYSLLASFKIRKEEMERRVTFVVIAVVFHDLEENSQPFLEKRLFLVDDRQKGLSPAIDSVAKLLEHEESFIHLVVKVTAAIIVTSTLKEVL